MAAESAPLTIAVIKPCCIGDCVMALPAIESLAAAFPYAHVHAFSGRHSAAVFRANEHISMVYLSPDQLSAARAPGMAWNLRTAGHDWIVLLDRSRWLIAAARSASPARLVTLPRMGPTPRHEIDIYLDAIRAAGVLAATTVPRITPGEEAREEARRVLGDTGEAFVILHPGGAENPGTAMLDKRWPADRFAQLTKSLAARGIRPVLTGGASDHDLCESISSRYPEAHCVNLAGSLDLIGTAAVIERAQLYVGNDTGISHIAAAVGTPSVVIFGPTNPLRYAPRGGKVTVLAPDRSSALPDADLRKAVTAGLPSVSEVSVDQVQVAIDRFLATGRGAAS